MSTASATKPNFVPPASIVAFAFIGVVLLIGLIARCLASNHSNIRSAHTSDLMIYQAAPRPVPLPRAKRPSIEQQQQQGESNGHLQKPSMSPTDATKLVRVQRGPKNL